MTLSAADARASMPAECRNAACVQTLVASQASTTWSSPRLFYPNNEEVFAAPAVGATTLAEVRVHGPGMCRHRFFGAGTIVVIKACGSQTPLRVRALRLKRGVRSVRISYAARPLLGDEPDTTAAPPAPSIFDTLRQITGLLAP